MKRESRLNLAPDVYLINVMHYIHQNPLRAKLVSRLEDWKFSSFSDYTRLRNGTLCNKELLMSMTDYKLSSFYDDSYSMIDAGYLG